MVSGRITRSVVHRKNLWENHAERGQPPELWENHVGKITARMDGNVLRMVQALRNVKIPIKHPRYFPFAEPPLFLQGSAPKTSACCEAAFFNLPPCVAA